MQFGTSSFILPPPRDFISLAHYAVIFEATPPLAATGNTQLPLGKRAWLPL